MNNSLVFKIKISKEEAEDILLRYLQLENLIGEKEAKYFTDMNTHGKNFLFEFCIPLKDVKIEE